MTGYGESEGKCGNGAVRVEVTSVNGKGLKVETDVPASIQRFKPALDTYIRSRLSRGTVRARIRIIPVGTDENVWELDEECLARYRKDLSAAAKQLGIPDEVDIGTLSRLPGVIIKKEFLSEMDQLSWDDVAATVESAFDALVADREREGECTGKDLGQILSTLRNHADELKSMLPADNSDRYDKYRARIEKLAGDLVPEDVIAREAAVIAERHDVSEEIQRLDAHMEELGRILETSGPVGNKLEFLSQEMQRETMTICSKVDSVEVSGRALEMRTEAQKIKEQVLNVE